MRHKSHGLKWPARRPERRRLCDRIVDADIGSRMKLAIHPAIATLGSLRSRPISGISPERDNTAAMGVYAFGRVQETNVSRIQIRCRLLLGAGILFAAVSPIQAQSVQPCTPGIMNWIGPDQVGGLKNAPFSATGKLTVDQKLPGGNAIHAVFLSRAMRDSAGRARFETVTRCWRGADGNFQAAWTVLVMDSIARARLTWDIDDLTPKVVH